VRQLQLTNPVLRTILASLAAFLALFGCAFYYLLGTPQYSLHLLKSAIRDHDLGEFQTRVNMDAVAEAATNYAVVTEQQEFYEISRSDTGEPIDSVLEGTRELWTMIGVSVKGSLLLELNPRVRQFIEGAGDESVMLHSPDYVLLRIQKAGRIAHADVGRKDGGPVWAFGDGPAYTLHLHLRQAHDRRWTVVEIAEVDRAARETARRTLLALPGMNKSLMYHQEAAAGMAIRDLNLAQAKYFSTVGHFAGSLAELGGANLIPADLVSGEKQGCRFTLRGTPTDYGITAVPTVFGTTGSRTFYSDKSQIVHENYGEEAATASSPAMGSGSGMVKNRAGK